MTVYLTRKVRHQLRPTLELKALPGLFLAGGAYRGVGIPDCVRAGELAADAALSR